MYKEENKFHAEGIIIRSSRLQMFFNTGALKNFAIFTGKHLCWNLFLLKLQAWRPPTQVFSCKYCEIFKSTCFYRTSPVPTFLLSHCFSRHNLFCTPVTNSFNLTFSFRRNIILTFFTDVFIYLLTRFP